MAVLKCMLGLVALLVVSTWAEEEVLTVSERIERANKNIVRGPGDPYLEDDVAYASEAAARNADPCTSTGCMWPRSSDGKVYVPYVVSRIFSGREAAIIAHGLESFSYISCIRFVKRTTERDYLNIQSLNGCWSWLGRLGNAQDLSLSRSGCVYHNTVQHELLHALGFHHEQKRADRDQYLRVLFENIDPSMAYNFDMIHTLTQGTSYDYGSVMQYHKYAFSMNGHPTMEAIPDPNVEFGTATEMSQTDILRLNRLYCS